MSSTPLDTFLPRPFPPPDLLNVPVPYILDQLHNLAVHFWDKPDTADCTIIIPIAPLTLPASYSTPMSPNFPAIASSSEPAILASSGSDPTGLARRLALHQPQVTCATRLTSKLHLDYLLAHSSLFRNLFRYGCIRDSPDSKDPNDSTDSLASPSRSPGSRIAPSRLPRLLSSSTPTHPEVLLPLPDPSSFPHLMHFMYFGTFTALETALDNGQIRWSDVVRNAEYLGMRSSIKAFLGRWYARHRALDSSESSSLPFVCGEGSDSADDDFESTDEYDSADDMEIDEDDGEEHDDFSSCSNSDAELEEFECESDSGTDESLATLVNTPPGGILASKAMALCTDKAHHTMLLDDELELEPRRGRTRRREAPDPSELFVPPTRSRHKA